MQIIIQFASGAYRTVNVFGLWGATLVEANELGERYPGSQVWVVENGQTLWYGKFVA